MKVIKNARIMTMAGDVFEHGYLVLEGSVIKEIGTGDIDNVGVECLDVAGGWVMPGLIDAHSHLGMWEDSLGFEGSDGNEATDPVVPHMRSIDGLNPMDVSLKEAYQGGVTSVVSGPGSASPVNGQSGAFKTFGKRIDDMVIRAPLSMKFALGENPKTVYNSKNRMPSTRMGTAALIRETIYKAMEYSAKKKKAAEDGKEPPAYEIKLESMLPLVEGHIPAHVHCHRADDICTAIRLFKEFGLPYTIVHGTEAHLIPEVIAGEGLSVITGPHFTDRSKPELRNLSFKAPAILSAKGIRIAICTDHPVIPEQYLMLMAALACKDGMDEYEALKAVTINPALICGLEERIGSLETGKDGDVVCYSGHPFDVRSKVEAVFINGIRVC